MRVDHSDPEQVKRLFERVEAGAGEAGHPGQRHMGRGKADRTSITPSGSSPWKTAS